MSTTTQLDCIDIRIGKLLRDAMSDRLLDPGREEDRRLFFDEHIEQCQACRDAMLEHANEIALEQLARAKNIETGDVLTELQHAAQQLEHLAAEGGISFEDALREALRKSKTVGQHS